MTTSSRDVAERVRKIKIGHPLDPASEIGPLIHPRHYDKVMGYIGGGATGWRGDPRRADAAGRLPGRKLCGADLVHRRARNDMRIAQEEIFGPVLTAIPFRDEAEALALANDVRYGLAGLSLDARCGRGRTASPTRSRPGWCG